MRSAVEAALRICWAEPDAPLARAWRAATWPAELVYRSAVALRGGAYDRALARVARAPVPVIGVGNLTVGGTGKTPLAGWVVEALAAAGRRPALVARGYARDELLLHARWHPDVPVHADPDRVRAARAAARAGADVVVLDDGFQHRRLARDLDLVVVAAEQPFPGALLPRGPYREPVTALRRSHWVVVTRRRAGEREAGSVAEAVRRAAPGVRLAQAHLAPIAWSDLAGAPAAAPEGDLLAVAGVGDPGSFAAAVEGRTGRRVELLAFGDHHEYAASDVERIRRRAADRTVVVTEKDAVKLAPHAAALPGARALVLGVEIEKGEESLRAALHEAARAASMESKTERIS